MVEYAAWVPTITGHLSFSLIGEHLVGCATANAEDSNAPGARRVALATTRTTRDLPFTGWPVTWLLPWIRARYLLVAKSGPAIRPALLKDDAGKTIAQTISDSYGVLRGRVICIPHHEQPSGEKSAADFYSKARYLIEAFNDITPKGTPGEIDALLKLLDAELDQAEQSGVCCLAAEFQLHRTGEFRLSLPLVLPQAFNRAARGETPNRFADLLAHQFYYFVKEAAHRHYHHDPALDNLLPLKRSSTADDESWRRETLWSLARNVLEVRRRDHLTDYKSAFGMLAYADAFQALLARVRRKGTTFELSTNTIPYDFAHAKASLEAKIDERSWILSGWTQFWTVTLTTVLAACALWLGSVQVEQAACDSRKAVHIASLSPPATQLAAPLPATSVNQRAPPPSSRPAPPPRILAESLGRLESALNRELAEWAEWASPLPGPDCAGLRIPTSAADMVAFVITHPRSFLFLFLSLGWIYLEFTRRSLRSSRASRWVYQIPFDWIVAVGASLSRAVRGRFPQVGDYVGALAGFLLASGFWLLLVWLFLKLLLSA